MRLFFAAYLSRENMDIYGSLVDGLIQDHPRVLRSVPRHTQHLTLAFLGELAESDADICAQTLDRVSPFEAFDYSLGIPSLLMGRGRPRLIRADVTAGDDRIRSIQEALVCNCPPADLEKAFTVGGQWRRGWPLPLPILFYGTVDVPPRAPAVQGLLHPVVRPVCNIWGAAHRRSSASILAPSR